MANVKVRMLTRQGTILSSRNVSFIKIIIYYYFFFLKNFRFSRNWKPQARFISCDMRRCAIPRVGALPLLVPLQSNSEAAAPVLTEQQLLTDMTRSLQGLYDKVQRSYDSASAVANLLSTDHLTRGGSRQVRTWEMILLNSIYLVSTHLVFVKDAIMTYLASVQSTYGSAFKL